MKTKTTNISYDWSTLKSSDMQNMFTVNVRNRFAALENNNDDITTTYANFIESIAESAEELIPIKPKNKRKRFSKDTRVRSAREKLQKITQQHHDNPTNESQAELKEAKTTLLNAYTLVEEEELNHLIKRVEESSNNGNLKESWNLINTITGRTHSNKGFIKGNSPQDRLNKWLDHFQSLLGKEPQITAETTEIGKVFNDLHIIDTAFTHSELQQAKKSIKEGKAMGPDNVPPEVLKRCDLDDNILYFANKILEDNLKPMQMSVITIIPTPKSGNLGLPENYRGISLTSQVTKLINKMILNRIQPVIDPLLRINQNGFRPGRSTTAHILALRRLIEGVKSRNRQAIILYIDFRKAFDSIHRCKMFEILKAYDIPPKLLRTIEMLHQGTKAKVVTPDGLTDFIEIVAGILQGDTLAPYLFALVLDYVLRKCFTGKEETLGFKLDRRRSKRVPPTVLTDLDFADDLAVFTEDIWQAQELLNLLETEASKVGLYCNATKTVYQQFNLSADHPPIISLNGTKLKEVNNFQYLGSWTESSEKDFMVRKALAWSALHKLRKVWNSGLSLHIKERLFISTVETVFLYGSETWTITKAMKKKIDGCYTKMLRIVKGVSWRDHMTNLQLYGSLPPVTTKIQQRRMRLAGHCVRHTEEVASNLVLWQPVDGRTKRGKKNLTYIDNLVEDCGVEQTTEIRSCIEHSSRPTSTLWVNMMARGGQGAKKSAIGQRIIAILPYIKQEIPVIIVFRALGFVSDRDILEHIIYDFDDPEMMEMVSQGGICDLKVYKTSVFIYGLFYVY